MNATNENLLKVSYPTVFKENFFFECGDGWVDLIREIANFIAKRTDKCSAAQVKEKFGSLRFYIDCGEGIDEKEYVEIAEFINAIERLSTHVCEDCGVKLTDDNRSKNYSYWIRNICKICKQRWDLRDEEEMIKRAMRANKDNE